MTLSTSPRIYLNPWEWNTTDPDDPYWASPGGSAISALDLRTWSQMGVKGGIPQGFGLFVYAKAQRNMLLDLGSDVEASITLAQRDALQTILGYRVAPDSLFKVVRELLLNAGDPTGQTRWKPLTGSLVDGVGLPLGGFGRTAREPLTRTHPAWQTTIDVFQADYRRSRAEGIVPLDALKRMTGDQMLRLGVTDSRELLPPEYRNEGWLPPQTTINDTFDRVDAATLGTSSDGTWSWTEVEGTGHDILSNEAQASVNVTTKSSRAEKDLSSANHYAQMDATYLPPPISTNRAIIAKALTRFDPTAATYYEGHVRQWDDGTADMQIRKVIATTGTVLAGPISVTVSLPDTIKGESNGSTIKAYLNAVEKVSVVDTAITGNLRTGIGGWPRDAQYRVDNFEAGDLGAAAVARRRVGFGAGWGARR